MKSLSQIRKWVDRARNTGVLSIIVYSILNKGIGLFLSVVIVRILSKQEFGYFSFANNIVGILYIFSGLGIKNGILQFCCEDREDVEKAQLYKFGFSFSLITNIAITVILFLYAAFGDLSIPEGRSALLLLSCMPIINSLNDYFLIFLRTQLMNTVYARATNIHSIFNCILAIFGAYIGGLWGFIIGQYMSSLISTTYILYSSKITLKNILNISHASRVPRLLRKNILRFSLTCAITNAFSSILGYLDVLILGFLVSDALVLASYRASATIPDAANFFTLTIMLCVYPYFVRYKEDIPWIKKHLKMLLLGLLVFNGFIAATLFFGANVIVNLVYGSQYLDAVPVFRVLAISFLFATTLRIPCGNILLMLHKERVNLCTSIFAGLSNIVLDIWLIPMYGSLGAAIATLGVVMTSSVFSGGYILYYLYRRSYIVRKG